MKVKLILLTTAVTAMMIFASCGSTEVKEDDTGTKDEESSITPMGGSTEDTGLGGGSTGEGGRSTEIIEMEGDPEPRPEEKRDEYLDGLDGPGIMTDGSGRTHTSDRKPSASKGHGFSTTKDSASGLNAGYSDDNRQFNYFIKFLNEHSYVRHIPLDVSERITINVKDKNGEPVHNAKVSISADGDTLSKGHTYSDGSFMFIPSRFADGISEYKAVVLYGEEVFTKGFKRDGKRSIEITLDSKREKINSAELDILFIFDTTGSMGEEIERLKRTIDIINLNLSSMSIKPKLRFGMVLYRDFQEEYVTKVIEFNDDIEEFRTELDKVDAFGGGDYPENLQAAMEDANKMDWSPNAVKLAFIITDAPAHIDYDPPSYIDSSLTAKKLGIKMFTIGTGGLDINGEYLLRQISQITSAKYIFLTYGERGESKGGVQGSVSHHTGANFQTDKLESIIIRFAKEELKNLVDISFDEEDEYFQAVKIDSEEREKTLNKLFTQAFEQLMDYSAVNIEEGTVVSVLPMESSSDDSSYKQNAEYFTEQLTLAVGSSKAVKLAERKDLNKVFEELELQASGLVDSGKIGELGNMLGAELLISSKLYKREDNYEIFIKLLRVETAEVLSVTKALAAEELGL